MRPGGRPAHEYDGRVAEHEVVYRWNAKGEWLASVRGIRGCRGRGRTLRQARTQLRAAIARVVEDPLEVDFAEDVRLPGAARRLVLQHWRARRKAESEVRKADAASRAALEALLALRMNAKDVGDLLGLSLQKLQKIKTGGGAAARAKS